MLSSVAQILKDKSYNFFAPSFFEACMVKNDLIIGLFFTGKGRDYSISGTTKIPLPTKNSPYHVDDIIDLFAEMPLVDMGRFFIINNKDYRKVSQKAPANFRSLLQIYDEAAKMRQNGQKNAVFIAKNNGEFQYTFFLSDKINKSPQAASNILPSLKDNMDILHEGNHYRAILGERDIFIQCPSHHDLSDFDEDDLKTMTSACFYPLTHCGFFPSQKSLFPIPWKKYCCRFCALCLLFLCLTGVFLKNKAVVLRQDLENMQGQILACRNLIQEGANIKQLKQERQIRQKKLLALEKKPYSNYLLLSEIASNLADDACLLQIERHESELTVRGLAKTAQAADNCYKNFKNLSFCQSIIVDYIKQEGNYFDFKFIFTLDSKNNLPNDNSSKERRVLS